MLAEMNEDDPKRIYFVESRDSRDPNSEWEIDWGVGPQTDVLDAKVIARNLNGPQSRFEYRAVSYRWESPQ